MLSSYWTMQDNPGPQSDCSCPDEEVNSCHRCSLVAGTSATIVAWWQQQCYDRQEPFPTFNIPLPCLWLHMPLSGLQTIYVSNVVNPHYLELVIFWRTFWCQIRWNCRNSRSSVLFRFVSQRWGDSETSSKCFLLFGAGAASASASAAATTNAVHIVLASLLQPQIEMHNPNSKLKSNIGTGRFDIWISKKLKLSWILVIIGQLKLYPIW